MGKHGCKKIPIFLRNNRMRMFSLLTALLATIAIVVGNGAINSAFAFDNPEYKGEQDSCARNETDGKLYAPAYGGGYIFCINTPETASRKNYYGDEKPKEEEWEDADQYNHDYLIAAKLISDSMKSSNSDQLAAAAYALHDNLDTNRSEWDTAKKGGFGSIEFIESRSKSVWTLSLIHI